MKFKKNDLKYTAMIVLSSIVYAIGIISFVHSGNLFPGGFAGASRLLSEITINFFNFPVHFSIFYFSMNILSALFVWKKHIGKKFVIYSIAWFSMTSFFIACLPYYPITNDPLLLSIFGGLINGFAIGLALQNNASSGGTDFLAIYFSMKYNKPTWNYIMGLNAIILVCAGLLFGWNQALYSIIFQFVSTQVVNSMHQRYRSTRIHVITNQPDDICDAVFHSCRHGITKIPCEGGYTDRAHWLLLITVNTYQLKEVISIIEKTDKKAFITLNNVERIIGNYYQKPLD